LSISNTLLSFIQQIQLYIPTKSFIFDNLDWV
jgi:hypothetical protein